MPKLPIKSGRKAPMAFERAGWVFARQRGSHMIMNKPGNVGLLSIPDHKELDTGTLRGLSRDSGLTVEEFFSHL